MAFEIYYQFLNLQLGIKIYEIVMVEASVREPVSVKEHYLHCPSGGEVKKNQHTICIDGCHTYVSLFAPFFFLVLVRKPNVICTKMRQLDRGIVFTGCILSSSTLCS